MTRVSDPEKLAPAFLARLRLVLGDCEAEGLPGLIWETWRSHERALEMVANGRSKAKGGLSMHCFGVAADCVCKAHRYDCHKHKCRFFERYGEIAQRHGLTWGGNWDGDTTYGEPGENDKPHVQAVPLKLQNKVRAMPAERIDAFVASYLAGLVQ